MPREGMCSHTAGVAQLVEHLICNQRVRGSNPFASSRIWLRNAGYFARRGGLRIFSISTPYGCISRCGVRVRRNYSCALGSA